MNKSNAALAARSVKKFALWSGLALAMGVLGGLLGAGFHHVLHAATGLRLQNPWLVWLLPLGGLLSVWLYQSLGLREHRGTNAIIESALDGQPVKPLLAPGIFLASCITHLLGGSAGREGAALQLGGSAASILAGLLGLRARSRQLLIMAGMSAVFAGLFGTPLTATVFCMEFSSVGTMFSPALLPCFLAAFTASRVSLTLGVHAEVYPLTAVFDLSLPAFGKYLALALAVSVLGIAMCTLFHKAEHWAQHTARNPFLRIAAGGAVIAALTALVGDMRFNGAGMDLALMAVGGDADWWSFLAKMAFTAITLAAGFKGGEIVPTFCIGATFGHLAGSLLRLDPGFAAALGLVGLFCCATNSPFASMLLAVEMFGGANLYIFAFVTVICFVLSGNTGLYASQIIQFDKAAGFDSRLGRED